MGRYHGVMTIRSGMSRSRIFKIGNDVQLSRFVTLSGSLSRSHHRLNMSLSLSYSSDEESLASVTKDAFGLTALPVAKKHRVENATTITRDAAPDVLAEVHTLPR